MVANGTCATHKVVRHECQEHDRPIIIRAQADASKSVMRKNKLHTFDGECMNRRIVNDPIVVIPKKRIVKVESIEQSSDRKEGDEGNEVFIFHKARLKSVLD